MAETVHSTEPERGVRVEKSLTMGGHSRAGGRMGHTGRHPEVAQNLPKSRGAGRSREGCVGGGSGGKSASHTLLYDESQDLVTSEFQIA